ncbi:protein-glutamate methylesterase/protein-glutamine glutaminase [Alteromonas sp. a30]|uniref:protein-glutamate methylesterase/protein-glutamine glutaminase n=1 Tax=Alteromonas sp. a30 TaxID=2730917 RepID=UPI00228254B3|nr:chemotaxis response regulator protein-glutamate methylesterase [Alteromonas sp. a30]MCY7294412.1 chemotaxis response regulator protein-glutamate methylesterase [Alteromonas sp. a30]
MPYKVLVVDDSTFFRRRVREILSQDPLLEVVGEARNGQEALDLVDELDPDVVTMDVEMPIMDGISAVKKIMSTHPVPIIMFSSLTYEGAQATLDALEAGALDFLPKKFEDIARDRKEVVELLQARVRALGLRKRSIRRFRKPPEPVSIPGRTKATRTFIRSATLNDSLSRRTKQYKLLAIGTSTGGPVALQTILMDIPATFPYPIILVQHMPGTFTAAFAERLNQMCQIKVKEAEDGDVLKPGVAYLAPGGKQMVIEGSSSNARISITESSVLENLTYKPSVDLTFTSLAKVFKGDVLGVILTGMGADGREGCRKLKQFGAKIWAQDEQSCVVYGMPQAVTKANISERNIALSEMADSIRKEM